MKLHFSGTSPYVRKCVAVAKHHGLTMEHVTSNPSQNPAHLLADNPLCKVPSMVTDDGLALNDSPLICEYLDHIGTGAKLFPAAGPARWTALRQQALGDGIMDATQPRRREIALPLDEGRRSYIELQQGKVARALDTLESEADSLGMLTTIGEVTIACALGYLDFRYANEPWRPGHPKLEAWYAKAAAMPAMARTAPPPG